MVDKTPTLDRLARDAQRRMTAIGLILPTVPPSGTRSSLNVISRFRRFDRRAG
jgi:hypothetical protein